MDWVQAGNRKIMNGILGKAEGGIEGYTDLIGEAVHLLNITMGLQETQNSKDYVMRLGRRSRPLIVRVSTIVTK
jgi:hypothetical protein